MLEQEPCHYRFLCPTPCPPDHIPDQGFKSVPEGLLCLDQDVLIPIRSLRREGRHLTAGPDSADKIESSQKKYSRGPKRRAAQSKFYHEGGGRSVAVKYLSSEKAKLSRQKYDEGEKGKKGAETRASNKKLFRKIARWLRDNPGKTLEDYTVQASPTDT